MNELDPFVTFILGIFTGTLLVALTAWAEERFERRHGFAKPAELVKPPALQRYGSQPERISALRKILDEEMEEHSK